MKVEIFLSGAWIGTGILYEIPAAGDLILVQDKRSMGYGQGVAMNVLVRVTGRRFYQVWGDRVDLHCELADSYGQKLPTATGTASPLDLYRGSTGDGVTSVPDATGFVEENPDE